ncbi:hypothetical protein [Flavobacterium silvaticum]|uniref:Uncharacterized protein n=1 Tax=Flavobacterium silvaticum TaxID=1852020 RepID=A0A972FY26_9FLAO|nr:hypothetical protein [Flavobacterium silvaticum]NMH26946.1 hypothetical protein [Flavobacterium silvaticum]
MKQLALAAFLLVSAIGFAQIDSQVRYNSNHRQFYQWNAEKQDYELRDDEYETSLIDVREINSNRNGYVVISLTDDGKTRMYHGSITGFKKDGDQDVWALRSKILKSKLVYDPVKKTIIYSFEASDDRYMKIFVFDLVSDL